MKAYINEVIRSINKQIKKSKNVAIIKMENFEVPMIYEEVCKYFEKDTQINLTAKLSLLKYEEFKTSGNQEWNYSLDYLKNNGYLDVDNAMTNWRNNSTELVSKDGKKDVTILMATEKVKDTGGLHDFFEISSKTISNLVKKDFTIWLKEKYYDLLQVNENRKAINTLFQAIYKIIPLDLMKFDMLCEELNDLELGTVYDIIEEICAKLNYYYDTPSIRNGKFIPKVNGLSKGKTTTASIINNSFKFIKRTQFENKTKEKYIEKYKRQIEEYFKDKGIDENNQFPIEDPIFISGIEFKEDLIDFISGKRNKELKEKFLKLDYSIVQSIFKFKLPVEEDKPKKTKEPKEEKVFGNPLFVYYKMISKVVAEYKEENSEMPKEVLIKVNKIKIVSGIENSDEEVEESGLFYSLCNRLSGIIDYINEGIRSNIKIRYSNDIDIFREGKFKFEKSSKMNELCNITYAVTAGDITGNFKFCFSELDEWINEYRLLDRYYIEAFNEDDLKVPLYGECIGLEQLNYCEADEEFFMKLQRIKVEAYDLEVQTEISSLNNKEILNQIGNLISDYKEFMKCFKKSGIYGTYIGNRTAQRVFNRYSVLLKKALENYDEFTSNDKDKVSAFLNLFFIGNTSYSDFKIGKSKSAMMAPYHPVMIEKIYYRNEFLKKNFDEVLEYINTFDKVKKQEIEQKLEDAMKLSNINSGVDIYNFSQKNKFITNKIYGEYSVYILEESEAIFISESGVRSDLLDRENLDIKHLLKKNYKSDILTKNIVDYINTFPSRADGINLLFVNPDDMQHIVAGIHEAVKILNKKIRSININVRILVPFNRMRGKEYLKPWLDSLDENIRIKTSLNCIDLESRSIKKQVEKYVENEDITYIYNILEKDEYDFQIKNSKELNSEIKYPAILMPLPISKSQDNVYIDISQNQFITADSHLQLTHKFMRPNENSGEYAICKEMKLKDPEKEMISMVHKQSRWVVCLDQSINKDILDNDNSKIIAFSTGKGIYGELNTTVSARNDILEDLQIKLKDRLKHKFYSWSDEVAEAAAKNCIEITKELDGAQLLRSLNFSNTQIHNYLAYVLTMQVVKINVEKDNLAIKTLINLDNYVHWFNEEFGEEEYEDNLRPDFLVLEVEKNDDLLDESKPLRIKATVIECKMGKEDEGYIREAESQMISGINKLSKKFNSSNDSSSRKYWFNQLYRALIFSKINFNDNEKDYDIVKKKIEDIFNGNFEIEWNGAVYAYWTDVNSGEFKRSSIEVEEGINVCAKDLKLYTGGQLLIQKLLLPQEMRDSDNISYSDEDQIEKISLFTQEDDEDDFELQDESVNLESEKIIGDDVENDNSEELKNTEAESEKIKDEMLTDDKDIDSNDESEVKLDEIDKESEKVDSNEKDSGSIKFLLGEDIRTKEKVYWEYTHKELNNRHLLINGNSGSGKTYCIQTLIMEAVKNNISVIVFDYTDGFTKSKLSPILLDKLGDRYKSRSVKYKGFPINPFKKGTVMVDDEEAQELDQDVANRIADSFCKVYKFKEQQRSAIYVAVRDALKEHGESTTLEILRDKLYESTNKSASTVLSKIEPLVDYNPFLGDSDFTWKDIINKKGEMYVIQLTGYTREIQVILTELILWDIWNYAVNSGSEKTPIPIVLDEAQNLSHDENSPSGKILAEGRKFGISGWYATQFMDGRLSAGEIGNLQQAAQKLYFSPPEQSTVEVSKYIDITNEGSKRWAEKLRKLVKGQCVTVGYGIRNDKLDKYEPKIIKVTSLEDRINE